MRSSLAALVLAAPSIAQVPVVQGKLTPAQTILWADVGVSEVTVYGEPGTVVAAYVHLQPTAPDAFTNIQLNNAAPGTVDFSLDGVQYNLTTVLDENGRGTLSMEITDTTGIDITEKLLPNYLTLSGVDSSGLFVEQDAVAVQKALNPLAYSNACTAYGCLYPDPNPYNPYRGPGDTVPPNLGGEDPPLPGENACDPGFQSCNFVSVDAIGCAADKVIYEVPMFPAGAWNFECVSGGEGDVGQVTYGQIRDLLTNSNVEYIDFWWEPAESGRKYHEVINYPVSALRAFCVGWNWLYTHSCVPINEIGNGVTRFDPDPQFGVYNGFEHLGTATAGERANGNGFACAWTAWCPLSGFDKMRIRYDRSCLESVIQQVNALNPGFIKNSTVLFVFGGEYCPLQ